MSILRNLRIYANRCPYCGKRMRLYSWTTAPFPLPPLTNANACVNKHYVRMEHVPTGRVTEIDEQGRPLGLLSDVTEFPDPLEEDKPIHTNLNVPLRKPPVRAAAPPPPAAPASSRMPLTSPAPTSASANGDGTARPAAAGPTASQA